MKQLKLDIDSLEIQSFSTARPDEKRGTVQAHEVTEGYDCTWYPELQCYSNPIAYPTEPRCDRDCRLTAITCIC
jgi:hypothetical protein